VEYFLGDARPQLLVCRPDALEGMTQLARALGLSQVLSLGGGARGLEARAAAATPLDSLAAMTDDDVVAMVYTSGTTGRSKGAMLTLRNLASNARTLYDLWGWRPDDVLLHALPVFHVHGLFVALHCAMLGGSTVLFHERFDVSSVRTALRDATVMMGVPTFYTRLLDCADFGRDDCAHMRLFISGSAPLLAATFAAFEARSGQRILERYGMTEAGMITSNPLAGQRVAGTVGFPLPGVELRVVDEAGGVLAPDQIGAIEIRGPNVFAGYWGMPEKTAAEFRPDGFFITGDLGSVDDEGRLTLVSRAKDLIISGGLNIYPKEIENCLDQLPGVAESAVIGVPQADLGEGVVAVVVLSNKQDTDEIRLLEGIEERLARFKRPRRIIFVDALPRNAMGKVQKQRLRETYRKILS
jgi:malonyl-CoA/methylmalonyl-CoA synthetase